MTRQIFMAVLSALMAATGPVAAQDSITGHARVIDGDTIVIRGKRIRLAGIDAPEQRQQCWRRLSPDALSLPFPCGRGATTVLTKIAAAGGEVTCHVQKIDRYRRLIARCRIMGADLGWLMVSNGWALAYRRYSKRYVEAENDARAEKRGLFGKGIEFIAPWDWRRGKRLQ